MRGISEDQISVGTNECLFTEEALETALLNCYLLFCSRSNEDVETGVVDVKHRIEYLVSQSNSIDASRAMVSKLQKNGLHHAAALLLASKKQFRAALEIWAALGAGEIKEEGRDGVSETIEFLSKHENYQEVWIFSSWILR